MKNYDNTDFISHIKNIQGLDAEYAIDTLGGSVPLYESLLKKTFRLLPSNIEQMDQHIGEVGDLGAFAVKAHGVKGSLNQIGCFSLAKLAESLEKAAKAGDAQYCAGHYYTFREELLRFYNLLNAAVTQAAGTPELDDATGADKGKLVEALLRAREATADFDAISAAEILAPFANLRFGADTDVLLANAMETLDRFKNGQALDYIEELLEKCGKPTTFCGQEETT